MSSMTTPRFDLPMLAVAQARKEQTHNEALVLIDALAHPAIEAVVSDPDTLAGPIAAGAMWVIGSGAVGAWAGRSGQIAVASDNGWRFVTPVDPMTVWRKSSGSEYRFAAGNWTTAPIIGDAESGTVIDIQARVAINALFAYLRARGIISIV